MDWLYLIKAYVGWINSYAEDACSNCLIFRWDLHIDAILLLYDGNDVRGQCTKPSDFGGLCKSVNRNQNDIR